MAFTLYSDLQARMISELGMCPSQIIQQELQRSGVKFFKDSGCWRYLMAPLDVVAGQTSYALVIPTGAQLWQIYEVRVITDPTQIFDQVWPVQSTAYYCTFVLLQHRSNGFGFPGHAHRASALSDMGFNERSKQSDKSLCRGHHGWRKDGVDEDA